jgi:hypothetical protein
MARLSGSVSGIWSSPGSLELGQHRLVAAALLAERCDLLGEILRARSAACRPVFDVAMVEPFEVFVQPLVGGTDERAQRRAGKVAVHDRDAEPHGRAATFTLSPMRSPSASSTTSPK